MKKTLLIVAVASLAMASCKKDRVCNCKITTTTTDPSGATQTDSSPAYDITLVKTSHTTAFRRCTHTKQTRESTIPGFGTFKYEDDYNCELK
jgi:hypothetical protein